MAGRLIGVASAFWLLVGVTWGTQRHVSASLVGADSSLVGEIAYGVLSSVPWIPVTVGILLLAKRYPLTPARWLKNGSIHLVGALATALVANVMMAGVHSITSGGPLLPDALFQQALAGATAWVHVITLLYFAMVGAFSLFLYREEIRGRELTLARMETELAQARLQVLAAQMRPHFLLNVLHGIGQLWRSDRAGDADRMLERLGDLFRKILLHTDTPEVSLAAELSVVSDFLDLERIRIGERLTVRVSVPEGARECAVPSMLLQPLVENAVRHGLGATSEAGRIEIRAERVDGRLTIEVEDDGPGPGRPTGAEEPGSGTGIENVRARLRHRFGPDQSLELSRGPMGGALVRIEMPATPAAVSET